MSNRAFQGVILVEDDSVGELAISPYTEASWDNCVAIVPGRIGSFYSETNWGNQTPFNQELPGLVIEQNEFFGLPLTSYTQTTWDNTSRTLPGTISSFYSETNWDNTKQFDTASVGFTVLEDAW